MPEFQITTQSGRSYTVDAESEEKAMAAASLYEGDRTGKVESFSRGAADTMTFGTADEIGAAVETLGGTIGDYQSAREEYEAAYDKARQDNPITYGAGQVAGAVAPVVATAGLGAGPMGVGNAARLAAGANVIRPATSVLGNVSRAALAGGAQGYAYGMGSGEGSIFERATDPAAALEAGVGAVAGPVGYAASGPIARGAQAVGNTARNLVGGIDAPTRRAARDISDRIDLEGFPADEFMGNVGPGQPLAAQSESLADYTAQTMRELPGKSRNDILAKSADNLDRAQSSVARAFRESVGGEDNSFAWLQSHIKETGKRAQFNYGPIWRGNFQPPAKVVATADNLLDDRVVRGANAMLPKDKAGRFPVQKSKDGEWHFARQPTAEELEILRRALADEADAAYTSGRGGLGNIYGRREDSLRSALDAWLPVLKNARQRYADDKAIERAYDIGKKAWASNAEELEYRVGKMSTAEKKAFGKGVWSDLKNYMDSRPPTSKVPVSRMFKTPKGRKIMQLAGRGSQTSDVARAADRWDKAYMLWNEMGNSKTAERLMDQDVNLSSFGQALADLGRGDFLQSAVSAGKALLKSTSQRRSPEELQAAVDLLFAENPQNVENILRANQSGSALARSKARILIANAVQRAETMGLIAQSDRLIRED